MPGGFAKKEKAVNKAVTICVLSAWLLARLVPVALAAEDPGVRKELTQVIAGQQLSCGKVVQFDTQGTRDYLVHCQDGSIYEVAANSEGRLVAILIAKKVQPVK